MLMRGMREDVFLNLLNIDLNYLLTLSNNLFFRTISLCIAKIGTKNGSRKKSRLSFSLKKVKIIVVNVIIS